MPARVDYLLFVSGRRAEKLKERTLRRFQREDGIVSPAQHEDRNGHMRHEVERVGVREHVRRE